MFQEDWVQVDEIARRAAKEEVAKAIKLLREELKTTPEVAQAEPSSGKKEVKDNVKKL